MSTRFIRPIKFRLFSGRLLCSALLSLFIISAEGLLLSQDTAFARKVIDTLSSPAMAGRGYTANGHIKAARYISESFRKLGLIPLSGNDYFQYFEVSANTFPGRLGLSINGKSLDAAYDFQPDPCSPSYLGTGRIVALKRRWLKNQRTLSKVLFDPRNSGRFLLIDESKPWAGKEKYRELLSAVESAFRESEGVSFDGLVILVPNTLTWHIAPGPCKRPVIRIIKDSLPRGKVKVLSMRIESEAKSGIRTRNVCALVKGRKYPGRYLVFSAHYDHLGQMGSDAYIPGANDDASGIAMMLDLARYFQENPPEYSVVFLAFAAEELGLIGSRYFTEHPLLPLDSICFMINLDIVGTGDEGIAVVNAKVFDDAFEKLKALNERGNYFPRIKARGKAANSDHYFFTEKGVPAFFIYTMGGISAYHNVWDRAETLPLTRYEALFRLLLEFSDSVCRP